jgi:hypothetical protein
MVRWFEGGVNQGLLPMTISDEESNLFRATIYWNVMKAKGKDQLEVSGVRGANSEASPHALFPFRPFPFRPFLISPWKW